MNAPRSTARPDPREIAELRALATRQPELAPAAALQIDLIAAFRKVQMRVATGPVALSVEDISKRLAGGRPLLDFDRLSIDWNDARLLFRQVTDILRRHDTIEADDAARLHEIGRAANLPDLARQWFEQRGSEAGIEMLSEVLTWALRPFLARAAEVLQQQSVGAASVAAETNVPFAGWKRGVCPVCCGEPDFACILLSGQRLLICGRCQARWPTDPFTCPYCGESQKQRITSFATPDGFYRVTACQTCKRYLKTIDARHAGRAAMPHVDAIATLPLDAVVMQKGFKNG